MAQYLNLSKKENEVETNKSNLKNPIISLENCKEILNQNGKNYTDEEIGEIRDFLYCLVEIDYSFFQQFMQERKVQMQQVQEKETGKIIQLNRTNELKQAS
ncbi:MAG: hypothetical protein WAQ28_02965 [Bacteroidia bacterium]|jgi:hypothetical protein